MSPRLKADSFGDVHCPACGGMLPREFLRGIRDGEDAAADERDCPLCGAWVTWQYDDGEWYGEVHA